VNELKAKIGWRRSAGIWRLKKAASKKAS